MSMVKITIYRVGDFKKYGGLKKTAKPLYANSGLSAKESAEAIKSRGYAFFEKPYFFSHIEAVHPNWGKVQIHQQVEVAGRLLITSPEELYKQLTLRCS